MTPLETSEASEEPKIPKPWISFPTVLIIIALVGVFLGIMTPFSHHVQRSRTAQARLEMGQIVNAASAYTNHYGRLPFTGDAVQAAKPDFTWTDAGAGDTVIPSQLSHKANNSELMAILCDLERFRDGEPTSNVNHARNPNKIAFLEAKQVNGARPGIDEHGVFRDPWGNPYIITIDVNGDGSCEDPLYRKVKGQVLAWSFGPDGKADLKLGPGEGVNADNVTTPR